MAGERTERRLAAIMALDIVGYSRLMEADEAGTLDAMRSLSSSLIEPAVAAHGGRIVKEMGDGSLVVFSSAVDAVACAIAIQNGVDASQQEAPLECRILYRIGINLADVVVVGADLYGDGVNVAARLEGAARPGGICISDIVRSQLAGKDSVAFEEGGELRLKNIARPVRVWHWSAAAARITAQRANSERPSVAVLAFENLSGQAEEAFFSDGITREIIAGLARFRSLSVVASNSSFALRDKPLSASELARQLGVSFVLEGSVRRAGDRIRVNVQLIEAASNTHVWAERYDRDLADVFSVQDDVARTIVATLAGRIEEEAIHQSLRKPTVSLAAYEYYLRGLGHLHGYEDDDNHQACAMFEAAIERDPQFARAYAYLALSRMAVHGYADAPSEILESAEQLARKATMLDEQESVCHRLLGLVSLYRRKFDMAERHLLRAHQLNPNDAHCLVQVAALMARRGRIGEAETWAQEGMRLNPFHPPWYDGLRSTIFFLTGRFAEAAEALGEMPNPGPVVHARLAACFAHLGHMREAKEEADKVLKARPEFSVDEFLSRVIVLELDEHRELFREGLLKAGLPR
ncbi:adenylate/guanylate cyclase domain-containing protein [Rhizobium sp. BK251]|uniref:adenylate/guanylate cyclase domain-containing protein n=1 Tax=Rhizobium sp. BK251 TaxID=2512125 RepID=UPI00104C4CC3|nr:adenylate/guanylate cyclase domain-containing protein [Rhizobium sp. BK251]TCL69675.1 TolB-like protein [Rhizobium sp. BK251]